MATLLNRRRYMGNVEAYSDATYIQNPTGLGYIDTGFKANNNTKVEFTIIPQNASYIFGGRNSATSKNFGFYAYDNTNSRYDFGNNYYIGPQLNIGNIWECYNEGRVMNMSIEGSSYTITANAATFQCDHNMYLFGTNNNGTPSVANCAKFISFKVYDNGTLIRHYIPKVRMSDGVYGLWDSVNSTFNLSPNGKLFSGSTEPLSNLILNYNAITDNTGDALVRINSSSAVSSTRATLLRFRSENNAILWNTSTPSRISDNYTLMHKESNYLTITLNNSSYYCAITVYVRNGTTYTTPYSTGWTASQLNADLSSCTGDEVWVAVNFKFNSAGSAKACLKDNDYTLTWS